MKKMVRPYPPEEMGSKRRATPEPNTEKEYNKEEEKEYVLNPNIDAPPPMNGSKRLQTDEERAAKLRLLPRAAGGMWMFLSRLPCPIPAPASLPSFPRLLSICLCGLRIENSRNVSAQFVVTKSRLNSALILQIITSAKRSIFLSLL